MSELQKFNILFSGSDQADVLNLCRYIDEFGVAVGVPYLDINIVAVTGVVGSNAQFPWPGGTEHSSPFKKVAAFTANFVSQRPIMTAFPEEKFGKLYKCQNAIIAYALSIDALEGATINCEKRKKTIELKNRIKISHHFWSDLILALDAATPSQHFECISLIYESLAYKANPDAQYPAVI